MAACFVWLGLILLVIWAKMDCRVLHAFHLSSSGQGIRDLLREESGIL